MSNDTNDTPITPINQVIPSAIADLTKRQTADAASDAAEEVVDYSHDVKVTQNSFCKSATLLAQDLSGDLSPDLVAWIKKRTDGGEDALLGENETLGDTINDITIQFGAAAGAAVNCELDADIKALNNKVLTATDTNAEVIAVQNLVQLFDFDVNATTVGTPPNIIPGIDSAINFILTDDVVADQVAEGNYSLLASALLTYSPGLTFGLPTPNPTSTPPIPSLVNQVIAIIQANVSTLRDHDNRHGFGDGGSRDQDKVLNIAGLAGALAAAAATTRTIPPLPLTTPFPAPDGSYSINPSFTTTAGPLTFVVPATAIVSATDSTGSVLTVSNIGGAISITGVPPLAANDVVTIRVDDGILPTVYSVTIPQLIISVPLNNTPASDGSLAEISPLPGPSLFFTPNDSPSLQIGTYQVFDNGVDITTPAMLNISYGSSLVIPFSFGDNIIVKYTPTDGHPAATYSLAPPAPLNAGQQTPVLSTNPTQVSFTSYAASLSQNSILLDGSVSHVTNAVIYGTDAAGNHFSASAQNIVPDPTNGFFSIGTFTLKDVNGNIPSSTNNPIMITVWDPVSGNAANFEYIQPTPPPPTVPNLQLGLTANSPDQTAGVPSYTLTPTYNYAFNSLTIANNIPDFNANTAAFNTVTLFDATTNTTYVIGHPFAFDLSAEGINVNDTLTLTVDDGSYNGPVVYTLNIPPPPPPPPVDISNGLIVNTTEYNIQKSSSGFNLYFGSGNAGVAWDRILTDPITVNGTPITASYTVNGGPAIQLDSFSISANSYNGTLYGTMGFNLPSTVYGDNVIVTINDGITNATYSIAAGSI